MPSFPAPSPAYNYNLSTEKSAVTRWFTKRNVPQAADGKLLLASWNIANLGEQKRSEKDLELIAHLLKRFELVAVQEVKNRFAHFAQVVELMGSKYDWIMNDSAGNSERLAFVYRKDRVRPGRVFAEIALPEKDYPALTVVVKYRKGGEDRVEVYRSHKFTAFDRNPFVGTFEAGNLSFTIANVHLYFGAFKDASRVAERAKYVRRVLEVHALARWAKKRRSNKSTYDRDIILVGDMNVPQMDEDDPAFAALKRSGLRPADYYSKTGGSNLGGTKTYDQLAITPGDVDDRVLEYDVFDFDNGVFRSKWEEAETRFTTRKKQSAFFNSYVKFHLSDHRPIWMQLDTT